MLDWTEYAKILVALLVIVDPIGAVPMFATMTLHDSAEEKKRVARIASISVALVLIGSALAGQWVLALFGISIASFKVGGAILILLLAISMMHGQQSREKQTPEEAQEAVDKDDIAVVPLAVPLLSGPGAISTIIIYASESPTAGHLAALVACAALVGVATWISLLVATPISNLLGRTGVNIAMRLMGLVLAAVAVEIFASGMTVLFPGLK